MTDSQNIINQNSTAPTSTPTVQSAFPETPPTASPSDFFPPIPQEATTKKYAGGKIVATFLGMLLLVGGVGAGLVLVQNPQLIKQQAAPIKSTPMPNCAAELDCSISIVDGATTCLSNEGQLNYCCERDFKIEETACVHK